MDPTPHDDAHCADAVGRLYHFLDGELDDQRRALVQRHLDDCLPCLEAFDFELELRQVIARKCRDSVPDQLRVRIALAIQAEFGSEQGPDGGMHPR
ncbi:MAG: mycothiol system anti-sigma-R factor [Acidimicrobiales bacterium]